MDLDVAWHHGSVPQKRRRMEIRRFKEDPLCRLFLSSDAGSLGLNLQMASVVINLDLPWNPARLEQRIARAWRKHQTSPVRVINLVTEESIEHRMLGVLAATGRILCRAPPRGSSGAVRRKTIAAGDPARCDGN
jgi:SNF2 family DNA or RNA helicase